MFDPAATGGIARMIQALMSGWNQGREAQGVPYGKWAKPQPPMAGWQPAPREGGQDMFQGPPTSGMGPAPIPPMPPQAGAAPNMAPQSPVPFMGMNGPGLGQGGPMGGGGNPWQGLFGKGGLFG